MNEPIVSDFSAVLAEFRAMRSSEPNGRPHDITAIVRSQAGHSADEPVNAISYAFSAKVKGKERSIAWATKWISGVGRSISLSGVTEDFFMEE
jgi:hypothetical protein